MRRYSRVAVVATFVLGLAVAAVVPPNANATNYYGGEDYTLTVRHTGKCLDREYTLWYGMKLYNQNDGAGVVQSACTAETPEPIVCKVPSACTGTPPLPQICSNPWCKNPNQIWQLYLTGISGPIKLRNKQSGKCLDVAGGSIVNYASAVQMPCVETDSQLWYAYVVRYSNGIPYYVLDNVKSGKCLEVAWWSTADAAAVVQGNCTWYDNQLWDLYNLPFNYHGK